MEKKEKLAFIVEKSDVMKWLKSELKEHYGIDSRAEYGFYHQISHLYVDMNDYRKAISAGFEFSAKNDGLRGICWVDVHNDAQPIGYIPIMYGLLPQERSNDILENFSRFVEYPVRFYPQDLKAYLFGLRNYCGVDGSFMKYYQEDYAFAIFVKAPFKDHELMVQRCKGFNLSNDKSPFIKIYYPECDHSLMIDQEKRKKEVLEQQKSYFGYSLFHSILYYPDGVSIAPHNTYFRTGHRCCSHSAKVELEHTEVSQNKSIMKGTFVAEDQQRIPHSNQYCNVTDSGQFQSEFAFMKDGVSISTDIHVARSIEGIDFDGQKLRDAFFTCLSGDGSEGNVHCTEYFVTIANGTRLLHYSLEFDSFEIFDLPSNWFVDQGLSLDTIGCPKVFDDYGFDHHDPDLKEVYEILNSRKKSGIQKVFVKTGK